MANNQMKSCSTFCHQGITNYNSDTATYMKMAKNATIDSVSPEEDVKLSFIAGWWECRIVQPLWKAVRQFLTT